MNMGLFRLVTIDRCGSTNTELLDHPELYPPYTALRALVQTAGKGRWGRRWADVGVDQGLALSLLFPLENSEDPFRIPLLSVLGVHRVLRRRGVESRYRWPNDLYVRGRKICGILNEARFCGEKGLFVTGIGVNVNQQEEDFPPEVRERAISLKMLSGREEDPGRIAGEVVDEMEGMVREGVSRERAVVSLEPLCDISPGEAVTLRLPLNRSVTGLFLGLGSRGELRVKAEGSELLLSEGEVERVVR